MKTLSNLFLLLFISGSMLAQTIDTSLVAYFPFNGNAIDETGKGHNGTVNGGILTNDRFNQTDKAYTFPNLHNNIVLDNSTSMNLENGFTLNTWVKYKNINCGIVGKHNCWVVNGFYLGIDNGHFWLRLANSVWSDIVTSEVYVEDQWYMVTGVYDQATSTGKVYVNGVLKASGSVLYNNYSSAPITISEASNGCPDGNMPGAIDEVKIYNRPLSDAEILAEYNYSNTDLVAYYPFNGNANDETGNGYNGTVSGATLTSDRFNQTDKAYNFVYNGFSSDKIQVSGTSGLNFSTSGFSLSAWIKFSGTAGSGNNYPIVSKHICGEQSGYILMLYNGKLTFWLAGSSGYNVLSTTEDYTDNSWHQVVAVYDGSNQHIYVDGVLKNSVAFSYSVFNSADWALGGYNGCNGGFNGKVDEVKIYNRPLSETEILAEYNSSHSDLVAYYPFNGNADDESGNGNNGSLMNGVSFENDRWNNPNQAIRFNKSMSQYVDVQNSPTLQIDSAISFSFWTKRNILDNGQDQVLNKGGDWPGGTCNYGLVFSEWTLCFIYNGGYYIVASPGVPLDYNWHHYAVTAIEGTTEIHFYVDGVEKASMFGGGDPVINLYSASSANLHIGGVNYFSNNTMDDLKIYNRILSEYEIKLLCSDLVAYLPFNGNANDESGNGYDGTINGNSALVPDRFNSTDKAFTFPDQSSNISLANSTNMNLENGFTLNAWVKYKNTYSVVIGKHLCGIVNGFILGIDYDGQFQLWLGNAGWQTVKTSATLVEDQWYMLTATYDGGSGTAKIYLDGQLENSATISYTNFSSYPISIGEVYQNNCSPANMSGAVDEVKIYSRALSDDEILDEYNNTYSDLVLFLPFNGNANDQSPTANNATVIGATLTSDRFGVNNNAYYFNGTSRLQAADNIVYDFGTDDFSMNTWINIETINTARIVSAGYNENEGIWGLGFGTHAVWGSGTRINFFVYSNNTFQDFSSDEITNYTPGNWAFISVIKQNNTIIFYFNGQPVGSIPMNFQVNSNSFLSVGCRQQASSVFDEFLIGKIDDIRMYNRALSDEEVILLYNDSTTHFPPLEDGLVAYWPLNGNTNDSTYNNNDGINHNCVYTYDRFSNESSSLYFDGNYYYVEGINPGNNLPIGNSVRTFSAWVKNYENNINGSNIFQYGTAQPAPTNFHFLITDVLGLGNGYGYGVVYGNTNLIDTTWHFVTGVYEGGTERITKLYVDGKLDASGTITTEPNTTLSTNWRMGRFMEGGIPFKGNLDEIKVYEIPLTSQQIWDMYKASTTAPNLIYPQDDSTLINPTMIGLVLDWDSTVTASSYRLLIANDSLFNTVIHDTLVNTSSFNFYDWFSVNIDNLYWKVRTINDGGIGPWSETYWFNIILTDVKKEDQLPTEFALIQNYPNPFNPSTTITYHLPKTANVLLKVYDVLGNEIATLVSEEKPVGIYNVQFTMNNLSSGIYFYKLTAGDYVSTKKMILIK